MAEKNRQYSIRLRNGEQEIEVHHDPEFISNIWSALFPGVKTIFGSRPASSQNLTNFIPSGTEAPVASLPEAPQKDSSESVTEAGVGQTVSTKGAKQKRRGGKITKAEQEEMQKLITERFEEDQIYQQLINTFTDVEIRSLVVLYMADQHSAIKGLSAVQLAKVLKERFKQSVNRSTIQVTLDKKSIPNKLVVKEESKYRIMQPGIERVKQLFDSKANETQDEQE